MRKEDLRSQLLARLTEREWHGLERGDDTLRVSGFNRDVLLHMRKRETAVCGSVADEFIEGLYIALDGYLREYMADCPQGHKWIILACIYLACVESIRMHPQNIVQCVQYADGYYCPCHSGEGSVCAYCVCKKLGKSQSGERVK